MKKVFLVAAVLFAVVTVNAQATKQVSKNQHQRIKQGVKSGELTKHETKKLVAEQKDIRQDKKDARADGVVTKDERKDIRKDERKASADIYRKKHNKRDRN